MSITIKQLRENYKPRPVKVLIVAESPPDSNNQEIRFFYNPNQERWDHLFRSIMKVVFPDFVFRAGEKECWLQKFKSAGYYLIDATDQPINKLTQAQRRRIVAASLSDKLLEIKSLVKKKTPIILVKKGVFKLFNARLRNAGYNVIHDTFLPFPAYGQQVKFIKKCAKCLDRIRYQKSSTENQLAVKVTGNTLH